MEDCFFFSLRHVMTNPDIPVRISVPLQGTAGVRDMKLISRLFTEFRSGDYGPEK